MVHSAWFPCRLEENPRSSSPLECCALFVVSSSASLAWCAELLRYYNNMLSIIPTILLGVSFHEFDSMRDMEWTYPKVHASMILFAHGAPPVP